VVQLNHQPQQQQVAKQNPKDNTTIDITTSAKETEDKATRNKDLNPKKCTID